MTRGDTVVESLSPTAVTSAKPAVVSVVNTLAEGQIVKSIETGMASIDGKAFTVASPTGAEFTLLGSDATGDTFVVSGASMEAYDEAELELMCWSSLVPNVDEPTTVSTATFCDPTASIPSAVVEAGSLSFAGFVDILDSAYTELLAAEADGNERILRIGLPSNGYLIAEGVVSSVNWDLPIDGAIGYTGTFALGTKMRHIY